MKNILSILLLISANTIAKENNIIETKGSITTITEYSFTNKKVIQYCDILKVKTVSEEDKKNNLNKILFYYKDKLLLGQKSYKLNDYNIRSGIVNESLGVYLNNKVFNDILGGMSNILKVNEKIRINKSKKLIKIFNNKFIVENTTFGFICLMDNIYDTNKTLKISIDYDWNNNFIRGFIVKGKYEFPLSSGNYLKYLPKECSLQK